MSAAMANKIEELPIYNKAVAFWSAVNAILDSPRLRRNRRLHEQISNANDSITSNMVEGFEQGTDRAFASFLTHSKASLAELPLARVIQRTSPVNQRLDESEPGLENSGFEDQ